MTLPSLPPYIILYKFTLIQTKKYSHIQPLAPPPSQRAVPTSHHAVRHFSQSLFRGHRSSAGGTYPRGVSRVPSRCWKRRVPSVSSRYRGSRSGCWIPKFPRKFFFFIIYLLFFLGGGGSAFFGEGIFVFRTENVMYLFGNYSG